MKAFSRRKFFFASSGAAAGSLLVPGPLNAAEGEKLDFTNSGLTTGDLKPLKFDEIPGFLSAEQIAPHHTAHYGGALKTFVTIESKFEESFQKGAAIDPQAFETMQRQKSSRGNSVLLHEMYFDGMTLKANDPAEGVRQAIEKRFGSLDSCRFPLAAMIASATSFDASSEIVSVPKRSAQGLFPDLCRQVTAHPLAALTAMANLSRVLRSRYNLFVSRARRWKPHSRAPQLRSTKVYPPCRTDHTARNDCLGCRIDRPLQFASLTRERFNG